MLPVCPVTIIRQHEPGLSGLCISEDIVSWPFLIFFLKVFKFSRELHKPNFETLSISGLVMFNLRSVDSNWGKYICNYVSAVEKIYLWHIDVYLY